MPAAPDHVVELLGAIRERAIAGRPGSEPWSRLLAASREARAIVATGELSKRAAVEFLRSVAESLGLEPESKNVERSIERGLPSRSRYTLDDGTRTAAGPPGTAAIPATPA